MSPKIIVPAHIMKKYKADEQSQLKKNREQRQAISEDTSRLLQEQRKRREAEQRHNLEKRIKANAMAGKEAHDDIKELLDEGWAYSKQLARERIKSRVEVLTMDKEYYGKEAQKCKEKELDAGFLKDTLSAINTELDELKIDLELSINGASNKQ